LVLQIAVCSKTTDVEPASFKIYILKLDIDDLDLGYEFDESWDVLQIRYEQYDPSLKKRIAFPEVHDLFKKLGKLKD